MKFSTSLAFLTYATQSLAFAPSCSFQQKKTLLNMANGIMTKQTGRSSLDPAVIDRYNSLPFPKDTVLAEYVWVDADGNTRSKTRTLPAAKVCNNCFKCWIVIARK